jgi:hypothetical protein
MNDSQKLDQILALLTGKTAATGAAAAPGVVVATLDALSFCGRYVPTAYVVEKWLALAGSTEAVVAAVNQVLLLSADHAQHPAAPTPSPGADWREAAAYAETVQSHMGWSRVTHLLATGEMPSAGVSYDPEGNLLAGVSMATSSVDMAPLVPEVLARAERGISWRGTAISPEELALRKEILANGPRDARFITEWKEFVDPRLLRVLVLGGALGRTRPVGSYSFNGADPKDTLEAWLFAQWTAQRPFPGSPKWGGAA